MSKVVLFASSNPLIQKVISTRLTQEGYTVEVASNGDIAAKILTENSVDLLVTEEFLPNRSGLELLELCDKKEVPSILISDVDAESKILHAFELGVYDFIDKPYSPNELIVRVKNVFNHYTK